MPLTTEEHARAEALRAKEAYDRGVDEKEEKEPWDTEHHIKPSQANHEVQVYCREYFDKPKRKEGEGIPKVRELYSMNDRQCGWHDLPNPNSGFRRTHLDWVGSYNVGGPKEQQMPSYWRKMAGKKVSSEPNLRATFGGVSKAPLEQNILERLAQMPAAKSSEFWREWVEHGLPDPVEDVPEDDRADDNPKPPPRPRKSKKPPEPKATWNERWSVTHSKDNQSMCKGHAQYFTSAQFLSGAEVGHPGAYLGLPQMKWRNVAKQVSHFPVGVEGRGEVGRRCLLV
eukprot:TRINITY_DN10784_c0_g1_i3.p1 TRINITY_DN10784_c0_g1~~TRINITY_DN10784_c0_g1_i3.p1  ORF type:complete len:284 (-),score=62.91 TRINITY_DN10784_c0_g1_i3:402-1253(-)